VLTFWRSTKNAKGKRNNLALKGMNVSDNTHKKEKNLRICMHGVALKGTNMLY